MRVIVCIDDNGGMTFNKRRQSKDSVLTERILACTAGSRLYISPYSAKLFPESDTVIVSEHYLDEAGESDYCFVEREALLPYEAAVSELIVCRWNRVYPADQKLDMDDASMEKFREEEFEGHSHEKITMEWYRK